ncbi:MAG TPA: GldG family protein, partial [Spirochaetales bacterium]|nr:GldG family protein [Spirochaetales bacterium]
MIETLRKRERLLLALIVVGLVLAAVASTMYYARLDLTSTRMFTLSDAAKALRNEIPESVRISYFVSKSLADRHPGPGEIEDFLRELESVSKGKVRVRVVDPSDDPAEVDGFGVAAQQMQVVERSEQRVAIVYTGIVVEYLDRHETIPSVLSTATLEYELVKAVRAVVS